MHWVCRGPDEGVDRNTAVPKVGRMSGRPTLRWSENDAARPEFPRLSTGTDVCIGPHRKVKPSLSRSIGEKSATGLAENPPAIFRGAFDRVRELCGGTGGGTDRSVNSARRIWSMPIHRELVLALHSYVGANDAHRFRCPLAVSRIHWQRRGEAQATSVLETRDQEGWTFCIHAGTRTPRFL